MAQKKSNEPARLENIAALEAKLNALKAEKYPVDLAVIREQISVLAAYYKVSARKVTEDLAKTFIRPRRSKAQAQAQSQTSSGG